MTSPMRAYLLQAYLNRELDQLAEEEFELELLRDPELAELALADTALGLGLKDAQPEASVDRALSTVVPLVATKGVPRPGNSKPPLWFLATAATLLLGLAGALGYQLNQAPQRVSGATLAYIDKQRAIGDQITITLPKSGPLVLMVPVASAQPCTAEIGLTQNGTTHKASALADDFGYASIVLAPRQLRPGALTVSVRCEGTAQALGEYPAVVLEQSQ